MWTPALFGAKHIGFFEIYGVSTQTRGVSWTNADKEGEVNFSRFWRTSFMDGPKRFLCFHV